VNLDYLAIVASESFIAAHDHIVDVAPRLIDPLLRLQLPQGHLFDFSNLI